MGPTYITNPGMVRPPYEESESAANIPEIGYDVLKHEGEWCPICLLKHFYSWVYPGDLCETCKKWEGTK